MTPETIALPSLRRELVRALSLVSIAWLAAVFVVVAIGVRHEVDELMDGALQEAAEILYGLLAPSKSDRPSMAAGSMLAPPHNEGLVWQIVDESQQVLLRSQKAPSTPLLPRFTAGLSDSPLDWRVYAMRLPTAGQALYVGQPGGDRVQSRYKAIAVIGASALAVGMLCVAWLRRRMVGAMKPLQELSLQVKHYDPMRAETDLPAPSREEFLDIREAIRDLGHRLAARIQGERAFSAHAAHALRTPLAGMEAQLAVAMKEASDSARPRLERTREAVNRLKRVVASLLALFRSAEELRVEDIDIEELVPLLAVESLIVHVAAGCRVRGDANLLAAAFANLLDNSIRHGARRCWVTCRSAEDRQTLTLTDDGPGVTEAHRAALQLGLDHPTDLDSAGLGLKLAALIARAHRGKLVIEPAPAGRTGLSVSIVLWADGPEEHSAGSNPA
jgi:signal transduction histidine kinase